MADDVCRIEPFHAAVNVAQLLKGDIGGTREYDINDLAEPEDRGRFQGRITLVRSQRSILVRARLTTHVSVDCSRCLKPMECPLEFSIEEEFFPTIDVSSGLPVGAPEDEAFTIDPNHILDLGEAVRQYALTAIPMKPLCRADCAGICPDCGTDLNLGKCDCHVAAIDPRWAKLAELKKKPKASKPVAAGARKALRPGERK